MSKFIGVPLETLKDRIGQQPSHGFRSGSHVYNHTFNMVWQCDGPEGLKCFAWTEADDRPMPPDLTPWEQEMFNTTPLPEEGWSLRPCPKHRSLFDDYSEEPE